MFIKKVVIENYKCFKGRFTLPLQDGLNILVGNNEAGKSTIIEAIHLALTGLLNGKYLKNELTQHLFNNEIKKEYIKSLESETGALHPPCILIEIYFDGDSNFKGNDTCDDSNDCGLYFKIEFDDSNQGPYEDLVKNPNEKLKSIPIEYYRIIWKSFGRKDLIAKNIPIKSAFIDSSSTKYLNGSDVYINRIIKDFLDTKELADITQAFRILNDNFESQPSIQSINANIKDSTKISYKDIKMSIDLSSRNAWETILTTFAEEIPFHQIGKGEQCIIKTNLALEQSRSQTANVILLEEPESHLTYSRLNELLNNISKRCEKKQIIVTTHSSFVANKLNLKHLILLNEQKKVTFSDLSESTKNFFHKLAGYDTLRLILSKKAILVEGPSDELIVQKAYCVIKGHLPIDDGIDVISVGTSFLRFLEIAKKISVKVSVVTDNDGNIEALEKKYSDYMGKKQNGIKIYYDKEDIAKEFIGEEIPKFNYNTLEPNMFKANDYDIGLFSKILNQSFQTNKDVLIYMKENKTECALKFFETEESIKFPSYIMESLEI